MSIRAAYNSGIIDYAVNGTEKYKEEAKKEESVISKAEEIMKSAINKIGNLEEDDEDESPIDWEKAKENATKHPEQIESNDIGIGTDGKPVNMDLWRFNEEFVYDDDKTMKLAYSVGSGGDLASYIGEFEEGKIIGTVPQYIMPDGKDEFYAVTDMRYAFVDCTQLIFAPTIPSTVEYLQGTFMRMYLVGCGSSYSGLSLLYVGNVLSVVFHWFRFRKYHRLFAVLRIRLQIVLV